MEEYREPQRQDRHRLLKIDVKHRPGVRYRLLAFVRQDAVIGVTSYHADLLSEFAKSKGGDGHREESKG